MIFIFLGSGSLKISHFILFAQTPDWKTRAFLSTLCVCLLNGRREFPDKVACRCVATQQVRGRVAGYGFGLCFVLGRCTQSYQIIPKVIDTPYDSTRKQPCFDFDMCTSTSLNH